MPHQRTCRDFLSVRASRYIADLGRLLLAGMSLCSTTLLGPSELFFEGYPKLAFWTSIVVFFLTSTLLRIVPPGPPPRGLVTNGEVWCARLGHHFVAGWSLCSLFAAASTVTRYAAWPDVFALDVSANTHAAFNMAFPVGVGLFVVALRVILATEVVDQSVSEIKEPHAPPTTAWTVFQCARRYVAHADRARDVVIVATHFATIIVPLVLLDRGHAVWGAAIAMLTFCVATSFGPVPTLERRKVRRRNKHLGVYGESAGGAWALISFFGLVAYWCRVGGHDGPIASTLDPLTRLTIQLLLPSSMALFMIGFLKWIGWKERKQQELLDAYWAAHPDLEAGEAGSEPARSVHRLAVVAANSVKESAAGGAKTSDPEKADPIAPPKTSNGEAHLPPYSPPPVVA